MVATDKVYCNQEHHLPYREDDTLGGHDHFSARAGNVIGGGDWSQDRLIPDAVRARSSGQPVVIRNPQAIRPWQRVLEPLAGYFTLAQKLWEQASAAGAYNFGPHTHEAGTVEDVIKLACEAYEMGAISYEKESNYKHEASWLSTEVAKPRVVLCVNPKWHLAESVQRTIAWYKAQHQELDPHGLSEAEITAYEALA